MNIKIVIFLIIICFLPSASAGADVWVAKNAGFIKSNQSISFENYLLKPNAIDNAKASVTIYKNNTYIETRDFNVNEFKRYDDLGVTLLGINDGYAWISISKLENREIWRPLNRARLKWGESYSIEGYTFNPDTFGNGSVNLVVSNNSITETGVFSLDGSKEYGNLKFIVRDINRTGLVELEFFTSKAAEIKAEMLTDKNEYFPDETVNAFITVSSETVQNVVGVILENAKAEISPDMFSAANVTSQLFQTQITKQPANSTLTINARIEFRDYQNNAYVTSVSKEVLITPDVAIVKTAPEDTDNENVEVKLYIYNSGLESKSVHVRDFIPDELGSKQLDWNVVLLPKNSTTLTYSITPPKPGVYFLPPATAQWNGELSYSKRVKVTVHRPYILITKTFAKNKSSTDVKLVINNAGDRPAQVKVSDRIPDGYIAAGETTWSGKLEGGEAATVAYSLQGNVETLPDAEGTYRDIRGIIRKVKSNVEKPKVINEGINKEIIRSEEIMRFMLSSFTAIAGIIAGAMIITYLLLRRRR